jgi:antitoxin component YwqK of YwqJK toxin-antitoxin module
MLCNYINKDIVKYILSLYLFYDDLTEFKQFGVCIDKKRINKETILIQSDGKIIYTTFDELPLSIYKYDKNDNLEESIRYDVNGLKHGGCMLRYRDTSSFNKNYIKIYNCKHGSIDGILYVYQNYGNHFKLLEKCEYKNGLLHGTKYGYYYNGTIGKICEYINGMECGLRTTYDLSGNITETAMYKDDCKHGISIVYNTDGTVSESACFLYNNMHGTYEIYDKETKKILYTTQYLNGKRHGKRYEYDYKEGTISCIIYIHGYSYETTIEKIK